MSSKKGTRQALNRREFIARSAAATVAVSLAPGSLLAEKDRFHPVPSSPLPKRIFGKTGVKLPILTFGCGSRLMMHDDESAEKILNAAIDSGIIYLDSAHTYGDGKSEERIGRLMPARRKEVLIQTKIQTRDKDQWWKNLEISLKRLNVDYVDTLFLHSLGDDSDLEAMEVKGGAVELLYKAKEQKLTRWIGISSHTNSHVAVKFLRRYPVDAVQMALNVATGGMRDMGFEEVALPVALEQNLGIIAMKVMGQDEIVGKYPDFDYATCLRYVLSLPVTSATVGMPKSEHLPMNLEVVRNFKPLGKEEMQKIKAKAQEEIRTSFFNFMAGHRDLA
ncbi:MAG TPA: aldo/keto reductase [archaeon]|nr:aldo/keto reductase [archaeon]